MTSPERKGFTDKDLMGHYLFAGRLGEVSGDEGDGEMKERVRLRFVASLGVAIYFTSLIFTTAQSKERLDLMCELTCKIHKTLFELRQLHREMNDFRRASANNQ